VKLRTTSASTISQKISGFIATLQLKDVPAEVRNAAKLHLLDGLATMLVGSVEPPSRLLRRHFRPQKTGGGATVLGCRERFSPAYAALINGTQGHVLDYDDAQLATLPSRPAGQQTHPTAPVLAAAMTLAEARRKSGAALLTSYIAGVEVACRLGDAVDPSHYLDGFHPTGTLGVFGAAAACSRLLELEPRAIRHALGIAGTSASGLRANRGTFAKGLNAGHAAENGLIAATLAADGFSASENIFDDPMGFFAAACRGQVDLRLLEFGRPFFFAEPGIAIKLYPCAGVLHPALDVTRDLRAKHAIAAKGVEQIYVCLDSDAARPLVYKNPKDSLEAKFSLNFAVAVALVDGDAGLKQFSPARLADRGVQRLMRRVQLVSLPRAKGKTKNAITTEVEIRMRGGKVHRGEASISRGHPKLAPSRAEIEDKFRQCAAGVIPARQSEGFLKDFWDLEHVALLAAWLRPLRR
jgi:2-methylcitrate dehydratase PrpD